MFCGAHSVIEATTGLDNTRYSIDIIEQYRKGDFQAEICGGEIVKYDVGGKTVCKILDSAGIGSNEMNDREMEQFAPRYLFTDQKGKDLYAFQNCSYSLYGRLAGELFKYDGNKFVEYPGTKISDSISDYYENELDYSRHEVTRGLEITRKRK